MLGHRSYTFLCLVPALALLACGGEKPLDEITGAAEEAIPGGGYHLAGTYTGSSRGVGDFSQLVLKTDGTYHARQVVACVTLPCRDVEQDGRFTLLRRETINYLQTYNTTGEVNGRYQYILAGDTLSLRKLDSTATFTPMLRSPAAWCAVNQDCALQDLQIGPCAGQYICATTSVCTWQCGIAPEMAADTKELRSGG